MPYGKLKKYNWDTNGSIKISDQGQLDQKLTSRYQIDQVSNYDDLADLALDQLGVSPYHIKHLAQLEKMAPVLIYGDYNADGIISSYILAYLLSKLGVKTQIYLPDRQKDGYGINLKTLAKLKYRRFRSIIAIDNGIVALSTIKVLKQAGIFVGIIDHHLSQQKVKTDFLIHQTKTSASGLSLALASQTYRLAKLSQKEYLQLLQLGAIGILADQMPLNLYNYSAVKLALASFNQHGPINPGLKQLVDQAGWTKPIDEYTINFVIGPRLNAAGRVGNASTALKLLTETNPDLIHGIGLEVERLNRERQTLTYDFFEAAKDKAVFLGQFILFYQSDIPDGILGLIAAKLSQHFQLPSLVINGDNVLKGSGRGLGSELNLTQLLGQLKDDVFIGLGGHKAACGFSLAKTKLDSLKKYLADQKIKLENNQKVDYYLSNRQVLTGQLPFTVQKLSPFGQSRPKPVFMTDTDYLDRLEYMGKNKNHLRLKLKGHLSQDLNFILFNQPQGGSDIKQSHKIVFETQINHYKGRQFPQFIIIDYF